MNSKTQQSWGNASWVGSRKALIKQSLKLTVRERLLALEELYFTSHKLANLKKHIQK